jgi:hypothetical protein
VGLVPHLDDAEHVVALRAGDGLARMILERSEDVAQRHLGRRGRLDSLEDQQPVLLEARVDLRAQARVAEVGVRDAPDARTEREIVADRPHRQGGHGRLLHRPGEQAWLIGAPRR